MKTLHVITPVKDSIETATQTIRAVMSSQLKIPVTYTVYNDFSTPETTAALQQLSQELGFELVNLCDVTDHPSPNYLLVLRTEQKKALAQDAGMLIVESDVTVQPHTLQALVDGALERPDCGIAASVTVDQDGVINYPYKRDFAGKVNRVVDTRKHCSFCCSLLTPALLAAYDFEQLHPDKNWFDVTISHESLKHGLHNYVFTNLPVLHKPHASRPWKQLKYKNPLLYYWRKFINKKDRI
ncbi:MAG: glycosyltransferase family 2 protein [Muribaculaceae bacterium]|nr:glycosyltransferase family 2 protein [Muribaculaceae bacterium]